MLSVLLAICTISLHAQQQELTKVSQQRDTSNVNSQAISVDSDSIIPLRARASSTGGISITPPSVAPLSPEAAAVVQYVNYPVDYCTGLPKINISLYEVKSGSITLPITLSYRSAGIKPAETSGWVGTGWVLDADPGLVRTVNSLPDDASNGYFNNPKLYSDITQEGLAAVVDGGAPEYDPDKFYYKLLSQSGTFYLQQKKEPWGSMTSEYVTHPYDLVYIDGFFRTYNLRDENGLLYTFGGSDDYYEYCALSQNIDNRSYITRWLCKSIQAPEGTAEIKFDYSTISDYVPISFKDFCIVEDSIMGTGAANGELPRLIKRGGSAYRIRPDGTLTPDGYEDVSTPGGSDTNLLKRKVPSTITFDGGKVHFYQDGYDLKYLTVNNSNGKEIKRVDFYISPYNSGTNSTKLDSLKISAPGCQARVYRFSYHLPQYVPNSGDYKAVDFYGFYNGTRSDDMVPSAEIESIYSDGHSRKHRIGGTPGNRNPRATYAGYGILNQIVSPEGVRTTLEYEPNKSGSASVNNDTLVTYYHDAGGMRIHSIRVEDPILDEESTRYYDYTLEPVYSEGEQGYGLDGIGYSFIGWRLPNESHFSYTQHWASVDPATNATRYSRIRTFTANPVTDIFHDNGAAIFYNTVKERMYTKENKEVTIFRYSLPYRLWLNGINDYKDQKRVVPFDRDEDDDFLYYKLYNTEKYRNDTLVERKKIEYKHKAEKNAKSITFGRPIKYFSVSAPGNNTNLKNYYFPIWWTLRSGCSRPVKETLTQYDDNRKETKTVKTYDYDKPGNYGSTNTIHTAPIKVTTTTSEGETITEEFRYPEDFGQESDLRQNDLIAQNRYAVPLEHRLTQNGDTLITRQKFNREVYTRKSGNSDFEPRVYFGSNTYGSMAYMGNEGELPDCYIWGYNNQQVIAKIEKCDYKALLDTLGSTHEDLYIEGKKNVPSEEFTQKLNSLREKLHGSQVSTYTYEPLVGMTSATTPDGMTTYYENDAYGRLLESYYYENGEKTILKKYDYSTPTNKNLLR